MEFETGIRDFQRMQKFVRLFIKEVNTEFEICSIGFNEFYIKCYNVPIDLISVCERIQQDLSA